MNFYTLKIYQLLFAINVIDEGYVQHTSSLPISVRRGQSDAFTQQGNQFKQ